MAEKTEIAWCDSTFNPWIGCQKVSAGCDNCYAETLMDKRYGRVQWGPHGARVRTSPANWALPRRWERQHEAFYVQHGHRRRVFCASLADVFDNQVPEIWRDDLFTMIRETPHLDWLLLTKRPQNIRPMLPLDPLFDNVWFGTTCEDQAAFDKRWDYLLEVPAKVRFISYEPAIGPLQLPLVARRSSRPDWVICGGESGRGYRDMPFEWAAMMLAQCEYLEIPFFMKQMAGKLPIPPVLMRREFPRVAA